MVAAAAQRAQPGTMMLRRLLPFALGMPAAIEWFCVWGIHRGVLSPELAAVVASATYVALFGALLMTTAAAVNRHDAASQRAWAGRQELAVIVDSADDAIISRNLDGVVRTWNHGAERMFGYRADEMVGQSITRLIPDHLLAEEQSIVARIAAGMRVQQYESVRRRKDGSLLDVALTISPVRDPDGRVIGASKMVRDITARRQADAALAALRTQLEQRVSERTAELSAANEELEAFAYAVAHDLRAPLRAMTGFSDALVEDFAAALPPAARDYVEQIRIGGRHLGELIDGLLVLSRCTRGELRRDDIDITALAEAIRRELEQHDPERKVRWIIEPGLRVRGDARMFEVVMRTLISNAWKFTARADNPEIRISGGRTGAAVRISVSDNGAGFDMKHADKLFRPFQRLHRQEEFPGTGIGLATAQRIVHRHGGAMQAVARVGAGATFSFAVPASALEAA